LLEELVAGDAVTAASHAALGRAYVYKYAITRQRQWEAQAAQACARAAELDPAAADVLLAQGELHAIMGLHAEALADADRALAALPDYYEAHVTRARALDGLSRREEAEAACRRAIALRPDDQR